MIILNGKKVSSEILENLKNKVENLHLSLAVIQIGDNEASNVYIKQKKKVCKNLNIDFNHIKLNTNVTEEEVLSIISSLNKDETTGILLQLPIPEHLDITTLQNAIDYQKDVDGLNYINVNKLINKETSLIPCTAKGIITLLKKYNIEIESKKVVVVGRSNLVGKPISNLFLNENATVTICHSYTKDLSFFTKEADILIVAVGKPKFITKEMIKEDVIIIDVGISRLNNKLCGDVDFENIVEKCRYITPVPGGVGPMTIACLAENIYEAYLIQKNKN